MSDITKTRWLDDINFALGQDPNNLSRLYRMKIPLPDQVVFSPASIHYYRGDGSRVGDGFITAKWIWDVISIKNLAPIMEFLGGADWVNIYVRTDRRTGVYPSPRTAFAVYYGIMLSPILSGQEGTPIARSPYAMQTVTLTFNNLVLQPSYI